MIRWCERHEPPVRLERGQRCGPCQRSRESSRPSRQDRGYGPEHQRARAELVATLPHRCRCGLWLLTASDMVAAHVVDGDPTRGYLPLCQSCNERAKVRPLAAL